ncbi:MAG: HEAT repeat domain-containing protein, partial [Anaerolineae bacterium]|nr:HEAT repeat domain-containing protein [Anaerolineae bacterium]
MRLSSRPDVLRLEARHDVEGLVQALGYKADTGIQQAALDALMNIGESAVPVLIIALARPNLHPYAADALLKLSVVSIQPLINVLKVDDRQEMRSAACRILENIGMFAIEPLVITLVHRKTEVRESARSVLVAIGALAVEPLANLLRDINRPDYARLEAVTALHKIGGSGALSVLLTAAQTDPSEAVREHASALLGHPHIVKSPGISASPQPAVTRTRGLSRRFQEEGDNDVPYTPENLSGQQQPSTQTQL